jgi:hypothetical protein
MPAYTEVPSNVHSTQIPPTDPLALTFVVLFALSEILGSSNKLKVNSVVQLIIRLIGSFKPVRNEDDLVKQLRQDITDLTESVQELRRTVTPTKTYRRDE